MNKNKVFRKGLEQVLGVHPDAKVPEYHSKTGRKRLAGEHANLSRAQVESTPAGRTQGKVALFATCYGNYNEPHILEDLVKVFNHNNIPVTLLDKEQCCGMPKLELGDLEAVAAAKQVNVPEMIHMIDQGWDIVGPVPSCVLMFKQELPLMFPDDADVQRVKEHIFDPFEYLMLREKESLLNKEFSKPLGKVSYHASCHLRVQNIGYKTREVLSLIPDTELELLERCSGHDGTYAVKSEFHDVSMKICRPVFNKVKSAEPDYYGSDCPMAGHQIENGLGEDAKAPTHPMTMLRIAYGL
jgi:Fe-S oxidoreductase